jgi:hypothetical protein
MRRPAVCLVLSLILVAPAAAQQGRITVPAASADQAGLKGSVGAAPAPAAEPDAFTPLPLPLPVRSSLSPSSAATGSQCRLSCSRSYYVCLSGDDDRCPQTWSRCVTGCSG